MIGTSKSCEIYTKKNDKESEIMKRKKEFNVKEFILSALSKVSRTQWYYGVTFVLFSFFNFYLAQNNLAVHNKATGTVLQYVNFLGILFGISFLLLIPILSQFNFKKWFPLKADCQLFGLQYPFLFDRNHDLFE